MSRRHVIGMTLALTVTIAGMLALTTMTFGPGGALYVSNFGFGAPAGAGQIVRVAVPN